jgi:hypothetical protein
MRILNKRTFIATAMTLIVMTAVGFVYAAWTASGTGEGYAKAGNSQALSTVDVSATTNASLYPGVTGNVTLKINNTNPFPVRITAVTLNGAQSAITADAGHSGCTTTGVTFTNQSNLTLDAPAGTQTEFTLNGAAAMSNASLNACQGATFTIPVSLTGGSNAS